MEIELDIDEELYEQLIKVADEESVSIESLIEKILIEHCDSQDSDDW